MSMQLLLCTDLDRTVLPNGPQPESDDARSHFAVLAARPEVTLVYVTGRDLSLVSRAVENYCLPPPDYVISDVGTMIYRVDGDVRELWNLWQQEIAPDWAGMGHSEINKLLLGIDDLQQQEMAKQNLFKSSYYVPLHANTKTLSRDIHHCLEAGGVKASLVWSIDEQQEVGLLDVLPGAASKQHAVTFLMQHHGFSLANTVFAGDSGNDLPVLASEIPAVLVANASNSVRVEALAQAAAQGYADALYIAQGGFMGMNGNYAAGVLEGVVHFQPEVRNWLKGATGVVHTHG